MNYQVIAFDLDGTLLNSQGQILESSKKVIAQLREKGIKIILVTGRHHTAARPYHYELQLDTPMICCNGAYIYDPQTNSFPAENPISKIHAQTVIDVAKKYDLHILLYSRNEMNFMTLNSHLEKFNFWVRHCPEHIRPKFRQCDDFSGFLQNNDEVIWKFVLSHQNQDHLHHAISELSPMIFSCEQSWHDRIDIAKAGNNKGKRLLELLTHWKVDLKNVIAFGDNHNDISMLTTVGIGVAMGNAEPEVKRLVTAHTADHNCHGIARFLTQQFALSA